MGDTEAVNLEVFSPFAVGDELLYMLFEVPNGEWVKVVEARARRALFCRGRSAPLAQRPQQIVTIHSLNGIHNTA